MAKRTGMWCDVNEASTADWLQTAAVQVNWTNIHVGEVYSSVVVYRCMLLALSSTRQRVVHADSYSDAQLSFLFQRVFQFFDAQLNNSKHSAYNDDDDTRTMLLMTVAVSQAHEYSALEAFYRDVMYKSTSYSLTYTQDWQLVG